MFWGYTPALDLNKELDLSTANQSLNILLVGTADGRHVIKTIAEAYKHPNIKYNFYIIETWTEQIARQVLLLNIILEPDTLLGLFEKVRIFMELYGNTIIRPPVSRYLYKKSAELVEAITDTTYLTKTMPIFNFSQLSTKDRNYMENVFKFWKRPESEFGIEKAWNFRVRKALGQRFPNRNEVYDCDYRRRLCDTQIISSSEYIHWRETGIAFKWSELNESNPNLTYASGVLGSGLKLFYHAYAGDIVTGPYIAYGIECNNAKMLAHSKRSTDVMEYNLLQMFYQITKHEPYTEQPLLTYPKNSKTDLFADFDAKKYDPWEAATPLIPLKNITMTFLSMSDLPSLYQKYPNYFDLMVFGNEQMPKIDKDLLTIGKNRANILFETQKFLVQLQNDDIRYYGEDIITKSKQCELILLREFDPIQDSYARFQYRKI